MADVTVQLNRLRQSPRKVRLVADLIRQTKVPTAVQQLAFLPKRAGHNLGKLLKSAIAAAEGKNMGKDLVIKKITVDEGKKLKRFLPAPRGRSYRITKRTSHITLTLSDQSEIENLKSKKLKEKVKTGF